MVQQDYAETMQKIEKAVNDSEFVLVGIGEEWSSRKADEQVVREAYTNLAKLLKGKPYFILTENEDQTIFSSPLLKFFIAAPRAEGIADKEKEEQWEAYLNWLSATIGHSLTILELGVGFSSPELIRWPFEKCAQVNQKAFLIRIHQSLPMLPEGMGERGLPVKMSSVALMAEPINA